MEQMSDEMPEDSLSPVASACSNLVAFMFGQLKKFGLDQKFDTPLGAASVDDAGNGCDQGIICNDEELIQEKNNQF